jgi:hypothetical protein
MSGIEWTEQTKGKQNRLAADLKDKTFILRECHAKNQDIR